MSCNLTTPRLTAAQLSANLVAAIHENSHNNPGTMADHLASRAAFGEYVSHYADAYTEHEPARYPTGLGRNTANKLYRQLLAEFKEAHPRVMLEVALINARAAHTAAYNAHAKAVLNLNLFDGDDARTSLVHPQPPAVASIEHKAPATHTLTLQLNDGGSVEVTGAFTPSGEFHGELLEVGRIKGAWLGAPQVKAPTVYAHTVQDYIRALDACIYKVATDIDAAVASASANPDVSQGYGGSN